MDAYETILLPIFPHEQRIKFIKRITVSRLSEDHRKLLNTLHQH